MVIKQLIQAGSLIKPPKSKIIKAGLVVLRKDEEVGEHVTENREEIIIVLQGKALVIVEREKRIVKENNLIFISENKKHNIKNNSEKILKYLYMVALKKKKYA